MLVMDEFMAADRYGLIPHEEAIQFFERETRRSGSGSDRTGSVRGSDQNSGLCV
mgnify:FL=1